MPEHPPHYLPPSGALDVGTLARLFKDTTNSYKYLFFHALLEHAEANSFNPDVPLCLREMALDMLALAWYPHVYFKLSFGSQDQAARELDALALTDFATETKLNPIDRHRLRTAISQRLEETELLRFVPFRLIRPFFAECAGLSDAKVNTAVAELSQQRFDERKPLYKIDAASKYLFVHPDWMAYFRTNLPIVRSWASWQWLVYMQQRNPSVPALSTKLFPPAERQAMSSQKTFWLAVMQHHPVKCIYSGELLSPENLSLDHYVPWKFVCHDQLWNIVPASPSANSSKSDKLPADRYFDSFIRNQHEALVAAHETLPRQKWEKHIEPFIADLKLSGEQSLLHHEQLADAYRAVVPPLLTLAAVNGFESDWVYLRYE